MRATVHDSIEQAISIPAGGVTLLGDLTLPRDATAIVVFAHGSGSSRKSPRNRAVAAELQSARFGTLLMDLLTRDEEQAEAVTRHLRFNIPMLATRLVAVRDWLAHAPQTAKLPVGYFGASTGAAAALVAAAQSGTPVGAVVSRGGRPDLAGAALREVRSPTLLIVGGRDADVLVMNQDALARLRCEKKLEIVPHATHLFEEPGALAHVTRLARAWFEQHLRVGSAIAPRDGW